MGATGAHIHLTMNTEPCFISSTNLSDSPPAEHNACCLSPRAQETSSELPQWTLRYSTTPAASSRTRGRSDVALDTRTGVPPWCCRRGRRGLSDYTSISPHRAHPTHPTPPTTNPVHALTTPGTSRLGGQAQLDCSIPQPNLIP